MTQKPSEGKYALVTGGSRGIGAAIVRRLAADGAGVAFTYAASTEKAAALVAEIEAGGGRALAIQADSAEPAQIQAAVERTVQAFGGLNILVNNAGLLLRGSVTEFTIDDFDRMFAVNVRAAFVATQAAARHMTRGDRVVIIGSIVAERSAFPGASVYSMTKSAIAGMVRGMAIDLAPLGITVNNVQPGPTVTDMNPSDSPYKDTILGLLPVGRMGTAEEIASLVAYLAGPESSFITGASLSIDGGYLA